MPDLIFYDGDCGMCHAGVRFVAGRDARGVFRFAPLGGDTFRETVDESLRAGLPDSVIVLTADGRVFERSAAALYILRRLGSVWRPLAWAGWLVPRPVRDGAYRAVATVRKKLFRRPKQACPVMSPTLRARCLP